MKKYFILTIVFVIILTIGYIVSPLSKIKEIVVEGNNFVSSQSVEKATRINIGDGFWKVNSNKIKSNVKLLALVEEVQVDYQFPHTLNLSVLEKNIVAYSEQKDGSYKMLLADGMEISNESKELLNRPIVSSDISGQLLYSIVQQLSEVDLVALVNLSEITKSVEADEVVVIFTRDGYELRMLYDTISENLQMYRSVIEELQSLNGNKGVINMFEAYWFEAYQE